MEYQELINDFISLCRSVIAGNLTGIYLHGSMAMGCFHAGISDIDLIVVTEGRLGDAQKRTLMEHIVTLNDKAPAKGLEISFVLRKHCKPFAYPTPFELHFSPAHLSWFRNKPNDYIEKMKGYDKDLAAHFTIINKYGISLYGEEAASVFGVVPRENYIDSIWHDIENAPEDILTDPIYVILNLCRVSAFLQSGEVLSKAAGGQWGLLHLDAKYHPLISQAANCYRSGQAMELKDFADTDEALAKQFADTLLQEISSLRVTIQPVRNLNDEKHCYI